MNISIVLIIGVGLIAFGICAVTDKPKDNDNNVEDFNSDEDIQNDKNDDDYGLDDYEDPSETESKMDDTVDENISLKITSPSQTFLVKRNRTVIMPCKVQNKKAVIIWKNNNGETVLFQAGQRMAATSKMEYFDNGSLQISQVDFNDAGKYNCSAMITEEHKDFVVHTLEVIAPPTIIQIFADDNNTTLQAGDSLTLNCIATGHPQPNISWHKDDERLGTTGEKLTISNVKHRDAGQYRCLADNHVDNPAYRSINIAIHHKPHVEIEKMVSRSDHSYDVEIKCIVHADPRATVTWKKNDEDLSHSDHILISHNKHSHILLIKTVNEHDFANYSCQAINSLGSTTKHIHLVRTPSVLQFIKPQKDVNDVILTWSVVSLEPVSLHELQYRKEGKGKWIMVNPKVMSNENGTYIVTYTLKGLNPGVYETRVRSQNRHGWSEYSEVIRFGGDYVKVGKEYNANYQDLKVPYSSASMGRLPSFSSSLIPLFVIYFILIKINIIS